LFCCYLQQRYKVNTFFWYCQTNTKKKPILLRWVFVRFYLQYYPISTLEVSPSVAGVPNMNMVFIECIIIWFLIKYIKLLKSVN
jgi:hypothetical protein